MGGAVTTDLPSDALFRTALGRVRRRDPEALAFLSLLALVSAAVVSDFDGLSSGLVALGGVLGIIPVWCRRRDPVVVIALAIGVVWLAYGAALGALPSPLDLGDVRAWIATEGRVLVVVGATAIARGIVTAPTARSLCRWIVGLITAAHLLALGLYFAGVRVGPFRIWIRDEFLVGLSSSHHVVGFLAAVAIIVALSAPRWFAGWQVVLTVVVGVVSIVVSGSRTSLVGILAGLVVVAIYRLDRRGLVAAGVMLVVWTSLIVWSSDRFSRTFDVVTRPEFASEVADAWASEGVRDIRSFSNSPEEANILHRISLWGNAWHQFEDSPVIGIGAFRQNDRELEGYGVRGVVFVATSGTDSYTNQEPHNVAFYLLSEVGVLGFALFLSPYAVAWRWSRRRRGRFGADGVSVSDRLDLTTVTRASIVMAAAISMVSSGVMATGLGLAVNAVIFSACGPFPRPNARPSGADDEAADEAETPASDPTTEPEGAETMRVE